MRNCQVQLWDTKIAASPNNCKNISHQLSSHSCRCQESYYLTLCTVRSLTTWTNSRNKIIYLTTKKIPVFHQQASTEGWILYYTNTESIFEVFEPEHLLCVVFKLELHKIWQFWFPRQWASMFGLDSGSFSHNAGLVATSFNSKKLTQNYILKISANALCNSQFIILVTVNGIGMYTGFVWVRAHHPDTCRKIVKNLPRISELSSTTEWN